MVEGTGRGPGRRVEVVGTVNHELNLTYVNRPALIEGLAALGWGGHPVLRILGAKLPQLDDIDHATTCMEVARLADDVAALARYARARGLWDAPALAVAAALLAQSTEDG